MTRRVHVLEVVEPGVWGEIEAIVDLAPLVEAELGPRRRAVRQGSERAIVPALRSRGLPVLVRQADRERPPPPEAVEPGRLSEPASALLHRAQRRAIRGTFLGLRVWHPLTDRAAIAELVEAGVVTPVDADNPSPLAAWRLRDGLTAPPEPDWDLGEALFATPDDLEAPKTRLSALVGDAAALAAAIRHVTPRRTHKGHLDRASGRALGRRLHDGALVRTGDLDRADPRWSRALDLLLGIEAVTEDPVQRTLHVEEATLVEALSGAPAEWIDRVVRRLAPPEVQPLLGALRAAVCQAGDEAIDEVVLVELLAEQQLGAFAADAETFEEEEGPLLAEGVALLSALGLVRRGPGAFAPTPDGRAWAGHTAPPQPVWISSDLELVVPPGAVGPLDRYRLERLAAPMSRDVVDRMRLHRDGLADWLVDHDVDEAIALLRRLSPAVPATVTDALRAWSASLTRIVLVRDVDLDAQNGCDSVICPRRV